MTKIVKLSCLFLFVLITAGQISASTLPTMKQVVFIRYRIAPTYFKTVLDAYKDTMAEQGFVEGKNIEYIDILTRSADKASIPDVQEAVHKYKATADMFITCGWVSIYAREILKKTNVPQLFVPVLESVALTMLPSVHKPPGTNLSGIYLMYPPEKILRISRLILPKIKKYAYVYDSRIPADMIFKRAYEQLPSKKLHDITLVYIDLAQGIEAVISEMKQQQVDAFGGIVGSFKHRVALSKSNIPIITSFTLDINKDSIRKYVENDNTVAGLFNPFAYCGSQAAEISVDVFKKTKTIFQSNPRPAMQMAFINMLAAKRLGVSISFEALESVDFIIK